MEWMILPLKRYFDFSGRSRRKEYWMFVLFTFIVRVVLLFLDNLLGLGGHSSSYSVNQPGAFAAGGAATGGILTDIFSIAILVPSISVAVRRLHDIDRRGWWLLSVFVAMGLGAALMVLGIYGVGIAAGGLLVLAGGVMAIVLLVWTCMDGTRGPNRFGPDPKGGSDLANLQDTFR